MWFRIVRLFLSLGCLIAAALIVWSAGLPDRAQTSAVFPLRPGETPVAPEVGALAPPLVGTTVTGKAISLSAQTGRPVILNFWATWCLPCVEEMPLLQSAATRFGDSLHIIGVNYGESGELVRAWAAQYGLTFDLVIDQDLRLARLYQVRVLPTTFIIRRDGIIARMVIGRLTWEEIEAVDQMSK